MLVQRPCFAPWVPGSEVARGPAFRRGRAAGQRLDLALEQPHLLTEAFVLQLGLTHSRREVVVVLPPVEPDLLRLAGRSGIASVDRPRRVASSITKSTTYETPTGRQM